MSANAWPTGQDAWTAYAARCTAFYPSMAHDWEAHREVMKARRNAAIDAAVAGADYREPPLSLEEEEALSVEPAAAAESEPTLF